LAIAYFQNHQRCVTSMRDPLQAFGAFCDISRLWFCFWVVMPTSDMVMSMLSSNKALLICFPNFHGWLRYQPGAMRAMHLARLFNIPISDFALQ
jgi:hypothetical protein